MRGRTNHIRELREAKQLSQRRLAELVRTSQQQVQRIEAGLQNARLDLAIKMAEALGVALEEAFPGLEGLSGRPEAAKRRLGEMADDDLAEIAEATGIDLDPAAWSIRCLLRGGGSVRTSIGSRDRTRFGELLRRPQGEPDDDTGFFRWDADGKRLLLNQRHLLHAHFTFEPGPFAPTLDEKVDLGEPIRAFLATHPEALEFEVEGDLRKSGNDPEAEAGTLKGMCLEAEAGLGPEQFLTFLDADGEDVWLRAADLALLIIPLWALHPELIPDAVSGETKA